MKRLSVVASVAVILCSCVEPPQRGVGPLGEKPITQTISADTLADCTGTFQLGLVAVNDLAGSTYTDPDGGVHPGGLYNTGSNSRPAAIDAVQPKVTAVSNVIGVATLGGSTMRMIADSLVTAIARDPLKATKVKVVNGAIGGVRTDDWSNPANPAWAQFTDLLKAGGIKTNQLRVVFFMDIRLAHSGIFADEVSMEAKWLDSTVANLRRKYPSVQSVYITPHQYVGYSGVKLKVQEPWSYWTAWAVQSVVASRSGRADPWTVVGPYIWANGLGPDSIAGGLPGRSDGREYVCSDFEQTGGSAGVHSGPTGAVKQSADFLSFLHTDASTSWYRK